MRLILVNPGTNVIFEEFPCLILNICHNTYPALQRIRVVVCSTGFFHKSKFIFEFPLKCLSRKVLASIIIIIIIVIVHLFTVVINRFHIILRKGVNLSQPKRGKIICLYKNLSIDFFIKPQILRKFQESSCGEVI